jgi:hypothetical protein
MNKERLLLVAKACRETVAPTCFDMSRFGYLGDGGCGTPGCALGNYAFRTDLQKAFKLREGSLHRMNSTDEFGCLAYDEDVVLNHFDITEHQAVELFGEVGCDHAKTHLQAATFIEMYVEQNA